MFTDSLFVTVPGVRLHVLRRGGPGPSLVLIHGLSDSAACWSAVVRGLGEQYDVIAYDLRAHGLSEAPTAGYTPSDHARDLLGLLDALELRQPIVMGHSLGAATAALASTLAPERIRRMLLEDPPWTHSWTETTPEQRRESIQGWMDDVTTLQAMANDQAWQKARRDNRAWSEEELRPWLESKRQLRMIAFESVTANHSDWRKVVDQISCETLLLSGSVEKWGLVSPETGREAMRRNPKLLWRQLPQAGHCIHRDCLDEYLALARPFLDRAP